MGVSEGVGVSMVGVGVGVEPHCSTTRDISPALSIYTALIPVGCPPVTLSRSVRYFPAGSHGISVSLPVGGEPLTAFGIHAATLSSWSKLLTPTCIFANWQLVPQFPFRLNAVSGAIVVYQSLIQAFSGKFAK